MYYRSNITDAYIQKKYIKIKVPTLALRYNTLDIVRIQIGP
jgi:hypothetical protein